MSALLAGKPLVQHVAGRLAQVCSELVVVRAPDQEHPNVDVEVPVFQATDGVSDQGPLAGIVAGLAASHNELSFVVATDAPLVAPALVRGMLAIAKAGASDVVCPDVGGFRQPLVSVYRKASCLPAFRRSLADGNRRILFAFDSLRVEVPAEADLRVWDPELASFQNANTDEALQALAAMLREQG